MIFNESFLPYRKAAHFLWNKILDEGIEFPLIGIVCGSGLSELSKTLEGKTMTVKYSDIPGYVLPYPRITILGIQEFSSHLGNSDTGSPRIVRLLVTRVKLCLENSVAFQQFAFEDVSIPMK